MRRENRKEDAVSPVIGVMLMMVITVVIAAVVVMFSTGLAGSTSTTPTALFEVSDVITTDGGELAYLNIRHKGGDVIPLSELQINLQSVGGSNSGISNMLLATDTKSSKDMTVGEYTVDPVEQQKYDKWISDVQNLESEIETLKKSVRNPTPDDPELGTAVYGEYPLENYPAVDYNKWPFEGGWMDVWMAYAAIDEKYVNLERAQEGLEQNGWTEENGPTPKIIVGGDEYPVAVLGQDKPTESIVSTGDIIHIVAFDGYENSKIYAGTGVKWTISYIPTNSIIAKGEFEVIAD